MRPTRTKLPPKVPAKPATVTRNPTPSLSNSKEIEPVQVFCRLRPPSNPHEETCVTVVNLTTVQLIPPEASQGFKNGNIKANQYTFTKVFDTEATQKAIFNDVALPLVDDVLHGKNSLLYAYGVTGSGKTHTMNGEPQDGGIVPRCLDVIFNSIEGLQTRKYIFKPDRLNGFDVQTEADAALDRQTELQTASKFKTPRRTGAENAQLGRISDMSKVGPLNEDQAFSVFVTYVEIYNNIVFDLLDETPIDPMKPKQFQSKILREDAHKTMYVHGVTEVEVKSVDEALEVLAKGQRRRRVAHTTLNAESSRSHSVFCIRVVHAPLDAQGAGRERCITIGQLALVDLAGSERNSRTKTSGERLREAGNINNSLMTLRNCIEILRENQQNGTNRLVPYRDSKITHLFKSYFEGEGKVRMVVCVNPRAEDYDETLQVMRFAELTQEVQIARAIQPNVRKEPLAPPPTPGLTPGLIAGRRRANRVLTEAYRRVEQTTGQNVQESVPFDINLVFTSCKENWPPLELQSASDDQLINNLVEYLKVRIEKNNEKKSVIAKKHEVVRSAIASMEQELILNRQEISSLKAEITAEREKSGELGNRLVAVETECATARRHTQELQKLIQILQEELDEKNMMLNQGQIEIERVKFEEKTKRQIERERIKRDLEQRCRQAEADLQKQNKRMRALRELLGTELAENNADARPEPPAKPEVKTSATPSMRGPPVTPRRRRSRSVDRERWLEHRPQPTLDMGTVFKAQLKNARSVNKLVDPKEMTSGKVSKYILTTQEQDSVGEVETKLFKGDIYPTIGGGAQVVLQDVEVLTQTSPTGRKRSSDGRRKDVRTEDFEEIERRCGVSIEGHPYRKKPCP